MENRIYSVSPRDKDGALNHDCDRMYLPTTMQWSLSNGSVVF